MKNGCFSPSFIGGDFFCRHRPHTANSHEVSHNDSDTTEGTTAIAAMTQQRP